MTPPSPLEPPDLGSWWSTPSGEKYRVVALSKLHGTDQQLATLEPQNPKRPMVSCEYQVLRERLAPTRDPLGRWPYKPTRFAVEQLQGKHGIRGIVGHDVVHALGWRSIDERADEIGVPSWTYLVQSVGVRIRTLWKDVHTSDAPMFNVPKTHAGTGNHQKNMYPPGFFPFVDAKLRATHAMILRAVQDHLGDLPMDESVIEHVWKEIKGTSARDVVDEATLKYAEQRQIDRERLVAWIEGADAR